MEKRGFYVKKCLFTGNFQIFINLEQFNAYLNEYGSKEWNKLIIYEKEDKSGKYTHNIKLVNNKEEAND